MSLAVSIFDLFTYAIPGSLYLGVLAYVAERLGWIDIAGTKDLNTTLLLVGVALASYLLGHITYILGSMLDSAVPVWRKRVPNARKQFLARVPDPKAQLLTETDPFLLLAAAEVRAKESAVEINRLRAGALMLRNCTPALVLAFIVSLTELALGDNRPFALCSAVLFLLAASASLRHGRGLSQWAISKTLQTAFWITGPDETPAPPAVPPDAAAQFSEP